MGLLELIAHSTPNFPFLAACPSYSSLFSSARPPKQQITDADELAQYRLRKRKEFEDTVRRVRWNQSKWVQYAQWEESQKDFARAR